MKNKSSFSCMYLVTKEIYDKLLSCIDERDVNKIGELNRNEIGNENGAFPQIPPPPPHPPQPPPFHPNDSYSDDDDMGGNDGGPDDQEVPRPSTSRIDAQTPRSRHSSSTDTASEGPNSYYNMDFDGNYLGNQQSTLQQSTPLQLIPDNTVLARNEDVNFDNIHSLQQTNLSSENRRRVTFQDPISSTAISSVIHNPSENISHRSKKVKKTHLTNLIKNSNNNLPLSFPIPLQINRIPPPPYVFSNHSQNIPGISQEILPSITYESPPSITNQILPSITHESPASITQRIVPSITYEGESSNQILPSITHQSPQIVPSITNRIVPSITYEGTSSPQPQIVPDLRTFIPPDSDWLNRIYNSPTSSENSENFQPEILIIRKGKNKGKFHCSLCDKFFPTKIFNNHMKKSHPKPDSTTALTSNYESWAGDGNNIPTISRGDVEMSNVIIPSNLPENPYIDSTLSVVDNLICKLCKNKFSSEKSLVRHIKNIHEADLNYSSFNHQGTKRKVSETNDSISAYGKAITKKMKTFFYNCKLCSFTFSDNNALKRHIKNIHDSSENYKYRLPQGSKRKLETIEYKCELCPFTFKAKKNLDRHIKNIHSANLNYVQLDPQGEKRKFPGKSETSRKKIKSYSNWN